MNFKPRHCSRFLFTSATHLPAYVVRPFLFSATTEIRSCICKLRLARSHSIRGNMQGGRGKNGNAPQSERYDNIQRYVVVDENIETTADAFSDL